MLKQLLQEIALGNTMDTAGLAVRLGTSPEMVKSMLEHLERSGALEKVQCQVDSCQGCGLADQCHYNVGKSGLWEYKIADKE